MAPAERRVNDAIIDAVQVRSMIRARRLRELYFAGDLFADPAWDMLLDLMAARLERRQVAVSSLCIAAAVPPTTALRWIKLLTDQGLLVRIADPSDGRRVFIELADQAADGMMNYLAAAHRLATIAP
jgi:DNA-binding MarR family transcriptional regulator